MDTKNKLRDSLKAKIMEKGLKRSSNVRREGLMNRDFKKMGIDKEKFNADLEAVKKRGGFSQEQLEKMVNYIQSTSK